MRERRNRFDEGLPQPMLSPMIDMIFLLLVFFIVSTMYMTEVKTVPVRLPQTVNTETVAKASFVVTMKKDGVLYLDGDTVTEADLLAAARYQVTQDAKFSVVLRADREVEYGLVLQLMDRLKTAGVTRFGLATENGKKK